MRFSLCAPWVNSGMEVPSASLRGTSSAYGDTVSLVDTLALKYPVPLSPEDSAERVLERFKDVRNALRQVQLGLEDAQHDVLLDDGARAGLAQSLAQAQRKAQALFTPQSLPPEASESLCETLGQGWVTSDEQALIDTLEAFRNA